VSGQLLRIVGCYRNASIPQPQLAIPAESNSFAEATPFVPVDPFQAFGRGCAGGGGWRHPPGGPFDNEKDHKKAWKVFKKMRGAHGGWGYGPRGHGPHGPRHHLPHGGPPGFPPHGGFGPHPHPSGFPPHDGFGPHRFPVHEGFHPPPPFGGHPHPPFHEFHGHHGHHDFEHNKSEKLVARFAKDVTVEDGTQIAANAPFVKTWRIRNEGPAWPAGCVLRFVGKHSDDMGAPEFVLVDGIIGSNQDVDVSVNLVAPSKPGRYTGYWKMCTPEGRKFGQRVWVSIVVPSTGSSSEGEKEADRYEALVDVVLSKEYLRSFGIKRHRVFRLLQKFNGNVEQVIALLTEKLARKEEKCARKEEKCALKAEKAAQKEVYKQSHGEWKH